MGTLLIVLMPECGNAFVQDLYLEFKNKSCYISSLEEIFRKALKMSVRPSNNCKKCLAEQTSSRNSIGLAGACKIFRNHLDACNGGGGGGGGYLKKLPYQECSMKIFLFLRKPYMTKSLENWGGGIPDNYSSGKTYQFQGKHLYF